jgi:hypothetical protein
LASGKVPGATSFRGLSELPGCRTPGGAGVLGLLIPALAVGAARLCAVRVAPPPPRCPRRRVTGGRKVAAGLRESVFRCGPAAHSVPLRRANTPCHASPALVCRVCTAVSEASDRQKRHRSERSAGTPPAWLRRSRPTSPYAVSRRKVLLSMRSVPFRQRASTRWPRPLAGADETRC